MTFARRVSRIAAIYGFLVSLPQYFLEQRVGRGVDTLCPGRVGPPVAGFAPVDLVLAALFVNAFLRASVRD